MIRRRIEIEDVARKRAEALIFNKRLKFALSVLAIVCISISTLLFLNTWNKQNQLIETRLETFTELRHSVIKRFLTSLEGETQLWSNDQEIIETSKAYFDVWETMTQEERDHIRDVYVNGKPVTAPSLFADLHTRTHPKLKALEAHHGYYDIFLFNLDGDLVYSVEKEDDYGYNFSKDGGPYSGSGLGIAFQKAILQTDNQPAVFVDFSKYAPSNNAPASFLASPMIDSRGEKVGVFAIQVPINKFNAVMQYSSGLGATGETYIVGPDYLMRNQSRLSKVDGVLKHSVKTIAVERVLAGNTFLDFGKNYVGKTTLVSGIPLEFNQTNWAVITEMEKSELQAPLRNYIVFFWLSILFIIGFCLVSYWILFARKVRG